MPSDRGRQRGWLALCALLAASWLWPRVAGAHIVSVGMLDMVEVKRGELLLRWSSSETGAPDFRLQFPDGCEQPDLNQLICPNGLSGELHVDALGASQSAALISVTWLDGSSSVYTLTAENPSVRVYGNADDPRQWQDVLRSYFGLGVEHILEGIDHLAFVLSLTVLVGWSRRLVGTITAFTVGHSITLAASALGWVGLSPAPVEALIALSIVLVCVECLHRRDTWGRRFPGLVAALFGLVHGFGFAGALRAIGLPEKNVPLALFGFNLGVEVGQIAVVGTCFALVALLRKIPPAAQRFPALRVGLVYAIGTVAMYWTFERLLTLVA
jgi:hydrogenase/urease accessory protein HupE